MDDTFDIFLVAAPGTEPDVAAEAQALGFAGVSLTSGGVSVHGGWPDVWRANVQLRSAVRVLARFATFRAMHLAQLDKRARKLGWANLLRAETPVRVEATCRKSKIYHAGAAAQRIETAIRETVGCPITKDAALVIKARIEDDLVTISLDTSGEALHKRGHKEAVGKAPMRETLAAVFLRQMGFDGTQTVLDPMCGSGTFVIEAAEIAAGLIPGRSRRFAFEDLANADPVAIATLRKGPQTAPAARFFGFDRDQGAIGGARKNAERAGVDAWCSFERAPISDLTPPEGVAPGIVIVNPPWGARIGERKQLFALYGAMGKTLADRFRGWTIGVIAPDAGLVKASGLPLTAGDSIDMGGTRVSLWQAQL